MVRAVREYQDNGEDGMKYFEDFQEGEVIKTRGRTITEADIVNFCAFSGDWYPLHSDVEYARNSPFGERIAHGMLVLSATSGLMPLYDMAIVAFYGMDKVRFLNPTKIGDTLHLEITVQEKKDKGQFGVVTFESRVKNQRQEDAALSILKIVIAKKNG
ncbi:MAG: MaoC/PaaZ C-terminal domain-containing protein [Thermodesulfobacteriota bacterium]